MLQNYLKIAFRNLLNNKVYSFINIGGLAIGLASVMATVLFLKKELSFDTFHKNFDNIYQVCLNVSFDNKNFEKWANSPNKVAPYLKASLPEIKQTVRILHHNFGSLAFVSAGQKHFTEKHLFFADASILELFDFRLSQGNIKTALARPKTAIIRRSIAQKYFGDQNPVGKTLNIDNRFDLEITGVFDDFEEGTHLEYDILGSFTSVEWASLPANLSWGNASFETFLLLQPKANIKKLEAKIEQMIAKEIPRKERPFGFFLRPLAEVHLQSDAFTNKTAATYGSAQQTNILIGLAFALLLIAGINYINLSTARLQRGFKEVGINKALGAGFGNMIQRFYVETFLYVTAALILSIIFLELLLPYLNIITATNLKLDFFKQPWILLFLGGVWLFFSLLSGAYPSYIFANYSPKNLIKSTSQPKSGSTLFRKSLVVFQFVGSIVLIVSIIVFQLQLKFLRTKELGFKPEQVVAVMVSNLQEQNKYDALENSFKALNSVKSVALSQSFPGLETSLRTLTNPKNKNESVGLYSNKANPEIIATLGIKLLAGRPLAPKQASDTTVQIVINRTAAVYLGYKPEQAIGKKINVFNDYGDEIVGVVEDFHFQSMHDKIVPFAFHNASTEQYVYMLLRIDTNELENTLASIESTYKKVMPNAAFEAVFLDQHLANLYVSEQKMANVVSVFAFLAIFIACLGLFGLATFTAEARTKEIGVRKVLGASVNNIITLLSVDFIKLVGIAIIIACPVAFYFMNRWLQNFAYRVDMEWWVFALAGLAAVAIAMLTVGYQALKAALMNPVKSLKTE